MYAIRLALIGAPPFPSPPIFTIRSQRNSNLSSGTAAAHHRKANDGA